MGVGRPSDKLGLGVTPCHAVLEVVVEVTHVFSFIRSIHRVAKVVSTARCERLGKCFCPSRAPQRGGNHKGRGTPLPFVQVALLLAGGARAMAPRAVPVGTTHAGTIDPGSKGCASHTSGVIRFTGIGRRCNGRAVAALCRCGSRPHRSGWAQGPTQKSKVWPSIRSSPRCVTRRKAAVDKAPCGGRASSLSASCQ